MNLISNKIIMFILVFYFIEAKSFPTVNSIHLEKINRAGVTVSYDQQLWKNVDFFGALESAQFDLALVNKKQNSNKRFISTSFESKNICETWATDKKFKKIKLPAVFSSMQVCAFLKKTNDLKQVFVIKSSNKRIPASSYVFKRQIIVIEENGKEEELFNWIRSFKEL